jgi:hypothetical protein
VLIAGHDDPLRANAEVVASFGFIEAHPVHPRDPPTVGAYWGLQGLVRTIDNASRRHRYGLGRVPRGATPSELGALLSAPVGECRPVWVQDDRLLVSGQDEPAADLRLRATVRWVREPLTWTDFSSGSPKLRAVGRRAYDAVKLSVTPPAPPPPASGAPSGYVTREPAGRTVPLYASTHPVTGDQLLSNHEGEAADLGYTDVALIGHLSGCAPVTGALGTRRGGVPWARHFGQTVGRR